jgi:colicin import membrane protein
MLTREELKTLTDMEVGAAGAEEPSLRDMVAATIRAAVINRWTRPPSARNGMLSVLSIQLVPTGEVVGVSVLQSSGNSAFDRSAMNAVERAGRFPEVAKLEDRIFEANFRRFQLIFKPEDLRY